MNDAAVSKCVVELTGSFCLQAELYGKLNDCVHRMYGSLVLSRGDLSQVMGMFDEKQRLVNAISSERERIRDSVEVWQNSKMSRSESREAAGLSEALEKTEAAIKSFLDIERQLERYLQSMAKQGAVSDNE
jgi:hypothetical protein